MSDSLIFLGGAVFMASFWLFSQRRPLVPVLDLTPAKTTEESWGRVLTTDFDTTPQSD
jgi:hypothetical protein